MNKKLSKFVNPQLKLSRDLLQKKPGPHYESDPQIEPVTIFPIIKKNDLTFHIFQ